MSTVTYSPSLSVVTLMAVTLPDVLAPAAIVGRFACVVKTVVPPLLTSTTSDAPVGAVPTDARTARIVNGTPVSLYSRALPVPVDTAPASEYISVWPRFGNLPAPFGSTHPRGTSDSSAHS